VTQRQSRGARLREEGRSGTNPLQTRHLLTESKQKVNTGKKIHFDQAAGAAKNVAIKMMVLTPLVLGMGFAVHPSPTPGDIDMISASKSSHQAIGNYVEVVRASEKLTSSSSPDEIRKVAHGWVTEGRAGTLRALPPESPDDTLQSGVKGQILAAGRITMIRMENVAKAESSKGEFDHAAEDLVSGAMVMEPLKFSGSSAVAVVGAQQKRMLRALEEAWPKVSTLKKMDLKSDLEELRITDDEVEMARKAERKAIILSDLWAERMIEAGGEPEIDGALKAHNEEAMNRILDQNQTATNALLDRLTL
jgi:hypothetical protein